MNAGKLSTAEIENKVDMFRDRIETIRDIIKDISDPATKKVLQLQSDQYRDTLNLLYRELERRESE